MAGSAASFDSESFAAALDAERASRKLNWKQVAAASGVSASTLTRLTQGKRPDVDGLARLLSWSGLDAASFVKGDRDAQAASPLARIVGELHADPALSRESAIVLEQIVRTAYAQLAARDARLEAAPVD